jgi:hypothetical protein
VAAFASQMRGWNAEYGWGAEKVADLAVFSARQKS